MRKSGALMLVLLLTLLAGGCPPLPRPPEIKKEVFDLIDNFADSFCKSSSIKIINNKAEFTIEGRLGLSEIFKKLSQFGIKVRYSWTNNITDIFQSSRRASGENFNECSPMLSKTIKSLITDHTDDRITNEERVRIVKDIIESTKPMLDRDTGEYLIGVIPTISGGVSCDELAEMLERALKRDRGDVIKKVASYIRRPFPDHCRGNLSKLPLPRDVPDAMRALESSQPKY